MKLTSSSLSKTILISQDVNVYDNIVVEDGITLHFCGGRLVNKSATGQTFYIQGDDVTIIAGPEQIFEGSFDFRRAGEWVNNPDYQPGSSEPEHIWQVSDKPATWTMERAYPQWFGAKDCSEQVSEAWELITGGNIAGGRTILNAIPDSSTAINAAIKLKRRGEVLIPRGYYRLTHSVNVLPGIVLRGEGCVDQRDKVSGTILFPWASSSLDYADFLPNIDTSKPSKEVDITTFDFVLPPNYLEWYKKYNSDEDFSSYRFGYLITACIGEHCTFNYKQVGIDANTNKPIYDTEPDSMTYSPYATGNRTVGTEISKLSLVDLMSSGNGVSGEYEHATLRGILIAGGVRISDVKVYGLSQFVSSTGTEYEDLHFIEHCTFTGPVMLKEASVQTLAKLYPEKIYAYELSGYGDGLVFHGNHKSQYSSRICALHLKSCNGGAITGNILNSDVLIERCQGIDFAGNHMEYGSRLTIASSGVAVRGNFIWRGEKAAITIRRFDSGGYLYYHCSVTLDNNQFFWRTQHYVNGQLDPPQAAHFLYPYDVVTDGYASIAINNTFRQCRRNLYDESSYLGILMGWLEMKGLQSNTNYLDEEQAYTYEGDDPSNIVGTDYARISDFEEFNRVSHIASIGSKVVGRRVTPMPSTIDKLAFDYHRDSSSEMCMRIGSRNVTYEDKDGWKISADVNANAYQDYQVWLFADYSRRLLMKGPVSLSSYYYNGGKDQRKITNTKQNLWIAIGQGNITNWNVPAGPYWAYIERQSYTEQTVGNTIVRNVLSMWRTELPVSDATMLWDDGRILSGYEWTNVSPLSGPLVFTTPVANTNVERVQYHGENVECLFSTAPSISAGQPQLVGEWLDGDVIEWTSLNDGTLIQYYYHNGLWYRK